MSHGREQVFINVYAFTLLLAQASMLCTGFCAAVETFPLLLLGLHTCTTWGVPRERERERERKRERERESSISMHPCKHIRAHTAFAL